MHGSRARAPVTRDGSNDSNDSNDSDGDDGMAGHRSPPYSAGD